MSTNTKNYKLIKPDQEDFYNVDDFNNNADIIDSQLKTLSDGLGSAAQESTVNSINTKIGETENTGGSATAGTIFAKLNKIISDVTTHMGRWTATRAGYIDTINSNAASAKTAATNAQSYTATNNTASKTGILSQKESYTHSLLENATYGLNAIKTAANGTKPSLTGTGTTVYSSTTTMSGNIKADNIIPIAKFVAPVNGIYTITVTGNGQISLWKSGFVSPTSVINSENTISCMGRYDPYYIYNKASIGGMTFNSRAVNYMVSSELNTLNNTIDDSNTDLFSGAKYIGDGSSSNFYCLAGEPVVIVNCGFGGSSSSAFTTYSISKVVVTYQTR